MQVVQQLLELSSSDPTAIRDVLAAKATAVLQQAGAGHFQRAQKAGVALVSVAVSLDRELAKGMEGEQRRESRRPETCEALLEAVIDITGGPSKAPKDKAQRAQTCAFISELAVHVGDHALAKETLLEYAEDKIPAIRERALNGLRHMRQDEKVVHRFMVCTMDNCKEVRTAAVSSMTPAQGRGSLAALLTRLDDTESCVREMLFNTLAKEPESVDLFGPGILSRLVVGLHDRSHLVQEAARKAVLKWVQFLGGPVQLLGKCDVFTDEFLGEDCASQISLHCREQSAQQARKWLSSGGQCFPGLESHAALLSRFAFGLMSEDERDDDVDIPAILRMVHQALAAASRSPNKEDFLLRQLLHITSVLDICDEVSRRHLMKLVVDVLRTAPVSEVSDIPETGNRMKATVHSAMDLGILLLRKSFGIDRSKGHRQAQENQCSAQVMAIIGEVAKVDEKIGNEFDARCEMDQSSDSAVPHFIELSKRIETMKTHLADLEERKVTAAKAKMHAVACEDFEAAHREKETLTSVEAELKPLKEQSDKLVTERDGICHRILAVLSSLLKWTQSDIRKDGELLGMFTGLIQPILRMRALSEEVNLRALHAIGLFSSIDVELAQYHWEFFSKLVQRLRDQDRAKSPEEARTNLRRAMLAGATLADCARLHGLSGYFDRDQVFSAASVLAVVPFESREVSIYPLCGWFMSFGALYFEEHMSNPQLEITWALGWMLTEAFSNKVRECGLNAESQDELSDEFAESKLKTQATDIMVFFNILAKHPGRHGEAMLCLAVEAVIESGLWRRAVSTPTDVHNFQFQRGFSWPKMFEFVRIRLPSEMLLRLWRCCLQVCVTSPALAPWAQIPLSLAAAVGNAPAGALDLVKAAIALGADADALSPIVAALPTRGEGDVQEQTSLLKTRTQAVKAEQALVADLQAKGVRISEWTPPLDMKAPKGKPSAAADGALRAVAMRSFGKAKRTANAPRQSDAVVLAPEAVARIPTPSRASLSGPSRSEADGKARGTKRVHSKTRAAPSVREGGDIE